MDNTEILSFMSTLKDYIKQSIKTVLTIDEAADYLGMSKSHLYKLTSSRLIPYSKPMGKQIYFNRLDLEEWALRNRVAPVSEVESEAANYLLRKAML